MCDVWYCDNISFKGLVEKMYFFHRNARLKAYFNKRHLTRTSTRAMHDLSTIKLQRNILDTASGSRLVILIAVYAVA